MAEPMYFQWQNEFLVKTIYPMREPKLRDFLVYYMEIDLWAQYKDKEIAKLQSEVTAYKNAQVAAAITAFKTYSSLRDYFMRADVRGSYVKFKPMDETELTEINRLHSAFVDSWPKDIRGERDFVSMYIANWTQHRNLHRDWIKSRKRRLEAMDPNHPKFAPETKELEQKEKVTLPMAEQELEQLRAFLATYDKIEKRKLEWYQLKKKDPNYAVEEAEYLVQAPSGEPAVRDIVLWKIEEYEAGLANKNQFELLEEVYQRFKKEPKRYPLWLQYMIVHFSGMRYASAHSSWADPKDLLIRLRSAKADEELKKLDAAAVEKLCAEKVAAYEGASKPRLALAPEKEWKDKVAVNLSSLKSKGPQTRRFGLTSMQTDEIAYEVKSMTAAQALDTLRSMKATFPKWAWKEIVKLTPLRVTEVTGPDWEHLTPEEETEKNAQMYTGLGKVIVEWENYDPSAWREEHGRTHELIVSRAVCNETAEHIQHIRGHLPPGGLTPKPKWYLANETENKISGEPRSYYTKAVSEKDYTPGASILWLRFVDKEPDAWQIAKSVETRSKVGLLPKEFIGKKAGGKNDGSWVYKQGEIVTRSRTMIDANKVKTTQQQWLRWIHEATVAEVAETAEGKVILTYETALPDDDKGTSSIGMFKKPLEWFLSDGTEDGYNRSFVGYVGHFLRF
ncbi:MAG: hypothetical protein HZB19_06685 [Chloroflexi bacterium]|nr:hypothetical protein [Chloroflexota bacterium]